MGRRAALVIVRGSICASSVKRCTRYVGNAEIDVGCGRTGIVEELFVAIGAHPLFQQPQLLRIAAHVRQRHLVGAEGAFDGQAFPLLGSGPTLGGAQQDHRPGPRRAGTQFLPALPALLQRGGTYKKLYDLQFRE